MYFHLTSPESAPLSEDHRRRVERVRLAQEFPGWTLEYIDQLTEWDKADLFAVMLAQQDRREDKQTLKAARRRR